VRRRINSAALEAEVVLKQRKLENISTLSGFAQTRRHTKSAQIAEGNPKKPITGRQSHRAEVNSVVEVVRHVPGCESKSTSVKNRSPKVRSSKISIPDTYSRRPGNGNWPKTPHFTHLQTNHISKRLFRSYFFGVMINLAVGQTIQRCFGRESLTN